MIIITLLVAVEPQPQPSPFLLLFHPEANDWEGVDQTRQ